MPVQLWQRPLTVSQTHWSRDCCSVSGTSNNSATFSNLTSSHVQISVRDMALRVWRFAWDSPLVLNKHNKPLNCLLGRAEIVTNLLHLLPSRIERLTLPGVHGTLFHRVAAALLKYLLPYVIRRVCDLDLRSLVRSTVKGTKKTQLFLR